MNTTELKNFFIKQYTQNQSLISGASTLVMNQYREKALDYFTRLGIPPAKSERYKYTDLTGVLSLPYKQVFTNGHSDVNITDVFHCAVPNLDTHLVFIQNGWYYTQNNKAKLPEGVIITGLKEAAVKYPDLVAEYYMKIARPDLDGMVALNSAFALDGIFLYLPDGVEIEKPIQVINILDSEVNTFSQQRNLIIVGKNARAKLVICDHTLTQVRFLSNSVTEIALHKNAQFDYYKIQNQHNGSAQISNTFVNQKEGSNLVTNMVTLHGGLVRNNLSVLLAEPHAEASLYGLYLMDKNQHIDNFTEVEHASPHCSSTEMYKGILDDSATGAFSGKIMVRPGAQKTQAYQSNKNLLLTNEARMRTKPQLEIYADDVKCSHGTTVGQIDEDALFYLRSRGINEKEARMMLMYAFCHEVIQNIRIEELKRSIDHLVDQRLRGELSKCTNCYLSCEKHC